MKNNPKRGEVWFAQFEPQLGAEIKKVRPCVVVSVDKFENQPFRIVMPVREYKEFHQEFFHFVPVNFSKFNGLSKLSTVDCLQIKSFDVKRFKKKIGVMNERDMSMVLSSLIASVGYDGK